MVFFKNRSIDFKLRHLFLLVLAILHSWCVTGGTRDSLVVLDKNAYRQSVRADSRNRLISLGSLPVSNIKFDIRYSTVNNFTGKAVYSQPAAYARFEVAQALKLVADSLKSLGMGLLVYDAYRPYSVTVLFWKLTSDKRYVANPAQGSRHNRGCAVDVGLYDLKSGKALPMPTGYDDFSAKAHAHATCDLPSACQNRKILQRVMTWAGFRIFKTEWWHFDFKGWNKYPLMNVSFEDLKAQ